VRVPVVKVGIVRVAVDQPRMNVGMRMRLARRDSSVVGVLVVLVVRVPVRMD